MKEKIELDVSKQATCIMNRFTKKEIVDLVDLCYQMSVIWQTAVEEESTTEWDDLSNSSVAGTAYIIAKLSRFADRLGKVKKKHPDFVQLCDAITDEYEKAKKEKEND
jgi:hypothetical protein